MDYLAEFAIILEVSLIGENLGYERSALGGNPRLGERRS